jgi:hypothetical protein
MATTRLPVRMSMAEAAMTTIYGLAGNDDLKGKDGNDTFDGGAGNDKIDGGKGIDTAIYHGNYSDFTVTTAHNGDTTVAGATAATIAANGTDTLKNVEFLKFNDAIVSTEHNTVDHFGTVDAEAQFSPTQLYFGNGNPPDNYHIVDNNAAGIQLDLKEIYRTGNDIAPSSIDPDGTAHFTGPDGLQVVDPAHGVSSANATRGAWNFNYVVDTGLNGSAHTLSDFDFKLVITQNGTNTHTFDLDAATHIWTDEANPLVGFGGDDFNHPASATVQSQVAENSVNLAFVQGAFGPLATSTAAGTTYDITLEALDHQNHLIAAVHDVVLLA